MISPRVLRLTQDHEKRRVALPIGGSSSRNWRWSERSLFELQFHGDIGARVWGRDDALRGNVPKPQRFI
jgi:hypothetical protein